SSKASALSRAYSFVVPPVGAAARVHLAEIDVALRVRRNAVDVRELAHAVPAHSAEEADHFHGCAVDDLHLLVGAVRNEEEALRLVLRKSQTEPGAEARGGLALDEDFVDERTVQLERLNSVVHAVADIDETVVRHGDTVHSVELLRSGTFIGPRSGRLVVRLVAVGAPMPLVRTGLRVEHDHAAVA